MASPLIRVPIECLRSDLLPGNQVSQSSTAKEQLLATPFADFLPCVLYECNFSLQITCVSPNARDLINVDSARLIGTRGFWEDRVFREDLELLSEKMHDLESFGSASAIHRIIDDSGLTLWVAHSARRVRAQGGDIVRGCIVPMRGEKRLQDLDQGIISRFVHKLGNHFQLLNLVISPLKKSLPESREADVLQQTVEKAIELTRAFSDYSQGPTWLSEVDLCEILSGAISTRKSSFAAKGIEFVATIVESAHGVTLQGDPFLLESAIGNVLQNALEATEKGGRVVFDAKVEKYDKTSVVRLRIADTGHGISPDDLPKVTAPFFTTRKNHDGLGLSMAARFIELHGGVLTVESQEGKGTDVHITLPAAIALRLLDR